MAKLSYATHLVSFKDFEDNCEDCVHLLGKVFVGNEIRVTIFCAELTCEKIAEKCMLCRNEGGDI